MGGVLKHRRNLAEKFRGHFEAGHKLSDQRIICGPFAVDVLAHLATRDGEPLVIGHRGVALLGCLLKRPGEVLTKTELVDVAWDGLAVEESNLSVQIAALRKALGPRPNGEAWIATVPRVGYRFLRPSDGRTEEDAKPPRRSIAVLPFVNLSAEPEQDYFGKGLAEELIIALSRRTDLIVVVRRSSFAYRGAGTDVREIGRDLNVGYVLEGSVRKSGNLVRLAVQLADTGTGSQLWASRYDHELTDIFTLQETITQRVVAELKVALRPVTLVQARETESAEAFDLYLRGRAILDAPHQDLDSFRRGAELLERALRLDPRYVKPHAHLAMALAVNYLNRWTGEGHETMVEAKRHADEAIALEPELAFVHSARALVALIDGDGDRLAHETEVALRLDPDDPSAISLRSAYLANAGQPQAAIPLVERLMRLEPEMNPLHLQQLAYTYMMARDYKAAAPLFRERIKIVPRTDTSRGYLVSVLGHLGRIDEAQIVWAELKTINPRYSLRKRLERNWFKDPADFERLLDGVRRAGIPEGEI